MYWELKCSGVYLSLFNNVDHFLLLNRHTIAHQALGEDHIIKPL